MKYIAIGVSAGALVLASCYFVSKLMKDNKSSTSLTSESEEEDALVKRGAKNKASHS